MSHSLKPFYRYSGADAHETDTGVRMPTASLEARVSNLCVSELLGRLERFSAPESGERNLFPWAARFVMGFPLPAWQRPLVWTPEQNVRFIQSLWEGVDVGTYMVNDQYTFVYAGNTATYRKFSEVLLDGQQRLAALEAYVMDKFTVPDAGGVERCWTELPRVERRRFGALSFARANIQSWDETELRRVYDLRSFGGTAHTDDQRAGGYVACRQSFL